MIYLKELQNLVDQSPSFLPFLSLTAGILSSFSPCILPLVPVIIGYVMGKGKETSGKRGLWLSFLFVFGMAFVYSSLGFVVGGIGSAFRFSKFWYYLAALISFLMGLKLLGVLNFELPGFSVKRPEVSGWQGAIILGAIFAVATSPCATPFLSVVLSVSATQGRALYGAFLLFLYSLGHGFLILLVGTFAGVVPRFLKHKEAFLYLQKASGLLFVGVGAYFLWLA